MSSQMHDPTGEYERHQRKLRRARKGTLADGVYHLVIGVIGGLLTLFLLGYLLWTHSASWYAYCIDIFVLLFCAIQLWFGWSRIRSGRRPVTSYEVTQAKQHHRQELQKSARGDLPATFSKSTRYTYLGLSLFFGLLSGVGWYAYASVRSASGELLGSVIGSTVALVIALLGFLASFAGKAHQRSSAAELKGILQAGEFAPSSEEEPQDEA